MINEDEAEANPIVSVESKTNKKLYFCSLVMGFAVLQPWNAITICMYYFEVLYKPAGYDPEFTLPMVNSLPLILCQIFVIAYGSRISPPVKVVVSLALFSFFFFVLIIFCKCITNLTVNFVIAAIVCFIIGVFNAIAQCSIGGIIGALGGNGIYMGANMIGNGISGILSNFLEFISLGIIGHKKSDLFKSTMLFFIIVAITMIASVLISYIMIEDKEAVKAIKAIPQNKPLKVVFKQAWPVFKGQGKNVFILFTMTLMIYPGVVIAKPLKCLPVQWSVPMLTFIFNLFDTIGRFIPNWVTVLSSKGTTYLCLLRGISILSICFIGYGAFNNFFVSDWWIILNMIIFAITNGLGASLTMMYGVNEADDNAKDDAGELLIFYMTSGICVGTLIAQAVFANIPK